MNLDSKTVDLLNRSRFRVVMRGLHLLLLVCGSALTFVFALAQLHQTAWAYSMLPPFSIWLACVVMVEAVLRIRTAWAILKNIDFAMKLSNLDDGE